MGARFVLVSLPEINRPGWAGLGWTEPDSISISTACPSHSTPQQAALNRKVMIEVHTRTQNPSDFVHYLDALSILRSETNCTTLSLIMLRNPLHHIYSDMSYFNRRYRSFEGNFTEFITSYVRGGGRLGCSSICACFLNRFI